MEEAAVFYYADESNVSWQPTLKAMWSPVGQQVMIPTLGQPTRHYGIGAVNYHSGQTVVQIQKRKKREQIALLLEELLAKHPDIRVYVAWGNADSNSGGKVEEVVRAAAGRLVLLYLLTAPGSTRLGCSAGILEEKSPIALRFCERTASGDNKFL